MLERLRNKSSAWKFGALLLLSLLSLGLLLSAQQVETQAAVLCLKMLGHIAGFGLIIGAYTFGRQQLQKI